MKSLPSAKKDEKTNIMTKEAAVSTKVEAKYEIRLGVVASAGSMLFMIVVVQVSVRLC